MSKPIYELSDPALLTRTRAMSELLEVSYASFHLTEPQASTFATLVGTFGADLAAWTSQETRTPVASGRKQASRTALVEGARYLINTINSNPLTTDVQRDALGIRPRRRPTPVPPPSSIPMIDVESVRGRTVTFRLHGGGTGRGRPTGTKGASVFTHVGPTAPTDPTAFHFEGLVTRTTFTVSFDDRTGSDTVWVSAFWYNERGQSGQASSPISVNLPAATAVPVGNGAAVKLKIAA